MRLGFVGEVSRRKGIGRIDLIEKDVIIHELLTDLSQSSFKDEYLFKGGTCLIKGYVGYYRFSEDIDFTWRDQARFDGLSQKGLRRLLSGMIEDVGYRFEEVSARRGLDFRCAKGNREYVELGGSDKMCTFKLWYDSETLRRRSFIKVQINFVEKLLYPPKNLVLRSLLTDADEKAKRELGFLYPEQSTYFQVVPFAAYDVREILSEKIRAILTREGVKARDFLDIYIIERELGYRYMDILDQAVEKTRFTLKMYDRYRRNFKEKKETLERTTFTWGEERGFLLGDLDEEAFYAFLRSFNEPLVQVVRRIGF